MKRVILLVSLAILFFSLTKGNLRGREDVRIMLDEYHAYQDPSDHLKSVFLELENKKNRNYIIRSYEKKINSFLLSDFDVLVLFIPSEPYEKEEREAIKQFVENGRSLIIFGEHGKYMEENNIANTINDISKDFEIEFNLDVVLDSEQNKEGEASHPIINAFEKHPMHPITEGVESIGYICGCSLNVPDSVAKLVFGNETTTANGKKGKDVVVLAVAEYGKGKVLAIGDTDFLLSSDASENENKNYLSFKDNKQLALNMFEWAGSVRKNTIKADELASEGHVLFSSREYSEAKSKFEKAQEIYRNTADNQRLSDTQTMIDECNRAIDAQSAYEKGMEYYDKGDYKSAEAEFKNSESLYDAVGDSERSGRAQSMIDLCTKYVDAESLYLQGMDYCNSKKYEEALTTFKEAQALYQELGDSEKIEELQTRIDETQKAGDKQVAKNRLMILFGILIGVAITFLVVYIFLKPETTKRTVTSLPDKALYCPSCGKENPIGALYCKGCGKPLKSVDELAKERASDTFRRKLTDKEMSEEEYNQAMKGLEEL